MSVGKSYLFLYNLVQFLGWSYLLVLLLPFLLALDSNSVSSGKLFRQVEIWLKIFQTAAVLEILHAAVGLVRSSAVLTFLQVFSRVFVTWAILHAFPESQICLGFPLLLTAWVVTEVIRYAFYALGILGVEVGIVVWLRYTLFIFLYPMGVSGELWSMIVCLDKIKKLGLYSVTMPNAWNVTFDFYSFLILLMLSYIPVFPQLYFHMFAQRKKLFGGGDKTKRA